MTDPLRWVDVAIYVAIVLGAAGLFALCAGVAVARRLLRGRKPPLEAELHRKFLRLPQDLERTP